jgi:L-alanine-DL-glutamate epimerase-like enolase superfamily enzyme
MLTEPLAVDTDGWLAVPSPPGLGVELDEQAVAHYSRAAAA